MREGCGQPRRHGLRLEAAKRINVITPSTCRMVVALTITSNRGQPVRVVASLASALMGLARGSAFGNSVFSSLQSFVAFSSERPATSTVTVELCSSNVLAMAEPTMP